MALFNVDNFKEEAYSAAIEGRRSARRTFSSRNVADRTYAILKDEGFLVEFYERDPAGPWEIGLRW